MIWFALLFLIYFTAITLAVLAYKGLWFSWYPKFSRPFVFGWHAMGGAILNVQAILYFHIPQAAQNALFLAGSISALLCFTIGIWYRILPARWMLPPWIRWMEGDPKIKERPPDFHIDTRVDRILRTFPFHAGNSRVGADPKPLPLYGSRPGKDSSD
ncbi:hypothetical protein [Actinomadura parmotrematis]|uniref:Uncharacterized protein n=1 Tax=Actinomadura parmotrematis TaxID=2864039 RepID=A0ABS7FY79_9ACTN|nr:hypothetical protein [Actinomadura parmotrematis]MBW8485266.1 hypothetical protein [Actinomadura parmotrematis]